MDELLMKAEDLGKLLADHPRFKALMAARDAVKADPQSTKLLNEYHQQVQQFEERAGRGQPIEVEDKRRIAQMEQAVASNERIKLFAKAQADFSELMSQINGAIYKKIASAAE